MLVPIGAPCYTMPGCDDGGVAVYRGIVVVRKADADAGRYTSLASLAGARLALNDVHSYSGCIALRAAVAPLLATHRDAYPVDARSGADAGSAGGDSSGADALDDTRRALHFFHPEIVRTGSHRASLRHGRSSRCARPTSCPSPASPARGASPRAGRGWPMRGRRFLSYR